LGEAPTDPEADPDAGVAEFRYTPASSGHASGRAETLRKVARQAEGQSFRFREKVSSGKESRINSVDREIQTPEKEPEGSLTTPPA
jgi:hypothetical protein